MGGLAVWLRRPDLLLLAGPILIASLLALARRPPGALHARAQLSDDVTPEGSTIDLRVDVLAPGAELVAVSARSGGWVSAGPGVASTGWAGRPGRAGSTTVRLPLRARRWGRHVLGETRVDAIAAAGLLRWPTTILPSLTVRVLPLQERFDGAAMVPQARGALGVHHASRSGDGGELSGVRPYAPGDRLRRVNWRVSMRADTARTGGLYVNATASERDAEVVLLLDARFDAGQGDNPREPPPGPDDGQGHDVSAGGLDVAVRAAASLARFYLRLGDRVGLTAHGDRLIHLPPRAGRGQLSRLLEGLLDVRAPATRTSETRLAEPPGLDSRALVILLSPLAGRTVHASAASLARRGHPIVVVDTLPPGLRPAATTPWTDLALRLWLLQRETRTQRLRELGVPVVAWQGPGSLDAVLRDLVRAGTGPRRGALR